MGQAWKEFHEESSDIIRRAFRKLGLSLAIDGSEDNELHVKDLSNIEVGDWRRNNEEDEGIDDGADDGINEGINEGMMDGMMNENIKGGYEYVLNDEMESNNEDDEDDSGDSEMDKE